MIRPTKNSNQTTMGGVDLMNNRKLVDCYFSPFLHHRRGREMVIFINNLCVVMRDSPFLVAQVHYSRMATQNKWSKTGVRTVKTYGSDPESVLFLCIGIVNSILVRFLQVRYRSICKSRAFRWCRWIGDRTDSIKRKIELKIKKGVWTPLLIRAKTKQ
jgi:hypothetical protein